MNIGAGIVSPAMGLAIARRGRPGATATVVSGAAGAAGVVPGGCPAPEAVVAGKAVDPGGDVSVARLAAAPAVGVGDTGATVVAAGVPVTVSCPHPASVARATTAAAGTSMRKRFISPLGRSDGTGMFRRP